MVIFLESPWPILFIGIAVEAVLGMMLMQSGRGKYLVAMIGAAVVVLIGLVVERLVVTDREAVEQTLDAAVVAVRNNNLNGLLDCIDPKAQEPRDLSRWVLNRCEVQEGHISDLQITVNRLTNPPRAEAKFLAVGKGRDRMGEFPHEAFAQRVVVQLQLQGNRWLVTGYKLLDFEPAKL
jgi:hypothetical protein